MRGVFSLRRCGQDFKILELLFQTTLLIEKLQELGERYTWECCGGIRENRDLLFYIVNVAALCGLGTQYFVFLVVIFM